MPKNVEIKARVKNFNEIIKSAEILCGTEAKVLNQEDTFFTTCQGRLKLRSFQDESKSQLIYYNRPDVEGPKISDYSICAVENHKDLLNILKPALGIEGVVKKTRYLFIYEQTRIHIDRVENLGDFVELEVVLLPNQTLEEGEQIANFLMKKLDICEKDLIGGAYKDLLKSN